MSRTPAQIDSHEMSAEAHDRAWWEHIAELEAPDDGDKLPPGENFAGFFTPLVDGDDQEVAGAVDETRGPDNREARAGSASRARRGSRSRPYTLEEATAIADSLRALPEKDPSQRRLDKQAVIRHISKEIAVLQQRGYTLEEVARSLMTGGLEITTPTLKNYLQRAKKADKEERKARRAAMPLVLRGNTR